MTDGQSASLSWCQVLILGARPDFCYCRTAAGLLVWAALSDQRRGLSFIIVAGLRQRSHSRARVQRTHDHILLSPIRDSNLEGQVPVFIFPRNRVGQLYPQALGSLFVASYDSQSYGGGIRPRLHTGFSSLAESESYMCITTDGQPASLSWNKAHIWGLRPDLYYCLTVASLLIWGALSDERTGLSFTIAVGPRQRSHLLSQIRDFPFHRLLRLAGSRWRYSTPPPHEFSFRTPK
jgi:hypothetical protein